MFMQFVIVMWLFPAVPYVCAVCDRYVALPRGALCLCSLRLLCDSSSRCPMFVQFVIGMCLFLAVPYVCAVCDWYVARPRGALCLCSL